MTRTRAPWRARAADKLTAVVVLPTPPFWFATVKTRVSAGFGSFVTSTWWRRRVMSASSRARGVVLSNAAAGAGASCCFTWNLPRERPGGPGQRGQSPPGSVDCSSEDARALRRHTGAELFHSNIGEPPSRDGLLRLAGLVLDCRSLEQQELAAGPDEARGERDQLAERTHSPCGDLVQRPLVRRLLGAGAHDLDVVEAEPVALLLEPRDAALHRLDEHEGDIRTCDGEEDPGESGAAADITDPAGEQGTEERGVDDVP